jgi:N-acetylmuramoyl-L-alanine amidase
MMVTLWWVNAPDLDANNLSSLTWQSLPDSFILTITTDTPIRYTVVDRMDKDGCFFIDILNIAQTYENRSYQPEDPRISKIDIQSNPEAKTIRLTFFPKPGARWSVEPGENPINLKVQLRQEKPLPNPRLEIKTPGNKENVTPRPPQSPTIISAPVGTQTTKPGVTPNRSPAATPAITSGTPVTPPPATPTSPAPPARIESEAKRRRLVIIDAGHGGYSKGARSARKINGTYYYEKDLVLDFAKKLHYLIEKSPNISAVMTRERDEYVSLSERVDFAQKKEGALFLSIHLNDAPQSSSARGIEIYHWAETGANDAALRYLEKLENDQDLPKVSEAQDQNLKQIITGMLKDALEEEKISSERACEAMWQSFQTNPYFRAYHRMPTVKSAHFTVLANYAMPAILIEVGFLSNTKEAQYLVSESFQWTTARLIYNGIQNYFARENPEFKPAFLKN